MNISHFFKRRQCPWRTVVLTLLGSTWLTILTTPFVAQADCVPKPDGLVAWWPGDGTAMDVVGTNHGTLQGGATYVAGKVGQAFSFDGVNSYVQLPLNLFPYPTSGTGNAPFSFELWFATSAGGVILGQQNTAPFTPPTGAIPAVYIGTDGKLYSQMFWKGSVDPTVSATPVNDGGFHHAAVTYDGANEVVFLDGVAIGGSSFVQQVYAGSYQYQIGTGYSANWPAGNGGWYSFNGLLDEVSLYNRALSSDEVASIYAAGSAGKCFTNDPAPVFIIQPTNQTGYILNSTRFTGVAMACHAPVTNGTSIVRRLQEPRTTRLCSPIFPRQMLATTLWSPPAPRDQPPARWQP
jgi:hypothetical protein